jgi:hypothetical protein
MLPLPKDHEANANPAVTSIAENRSNGSALCVGNLFLTKFRRLPQMVESAWRAGSGRLVRQTIRARPPFQCCSSQFYRAIYCKTMAAVGGGSSFLQSSRKQQANPLPSF